MRKVITLSVGMAFTAIMLTAPLTAQNSIKSEVQIRGIEPKNASLSANRASDLFLQLRSDSKPFPEYGISYTSSGEYSAKAIFEYDASGNIAFLFVYNWDGNDWINDSKFVYENNSSSKKEPSYISYIWKNNDWVYSSKYVYENDAAGNLTLLETYEWENNNWVGRYKSVTEYINGEISNEHYYDWVNNGWELSNAIYLPFDKKITYFIVNGSIYFGYPFVNGGHAHYVFPQTNEINVEYDTKGNLILFECDYRTFRIIYNDENNPVSIEGLLRGEVNLKVNYEYDENGNRTLFEDIDWNGSEWVLDFKIVTDYDTQGNLILYENYDGDEESNTWKLERRTEEKYDLNGNRIYYFDGSYCSINKYDDKGNQLAIYNYNLIDNIWGLSDYTIYYPNTSLNAEVKNNTPVGESNQGSFDIEVNVSAYDIESGKLIVGLPEDFTLDEANTILVQDFADKFELNITKQTSNSWLLEIEHKSANSAAQSSGEAATLLHIAYKVDEKIKQGVYDVMIGYILFETTTDEMPIPIPVITLPIEVTRWGVSNKQVNTTEPNAYITNNTLYIKATQQEQVSVYNLTGSKLYETSVSAAGIATIDATTFPKGVLIIKGSSGWAKKVKK